MDFEEWKVKAGEALNTVVGAASRAASSVKTGVNVYAEEDKIKTAYQALGKLYYGDVKEGNPTSGDAYEVQLAKIEAALARIQELKEQGNVNPKGSASGETVTEEDFADTSDT